MANGPGLMSRQYAIKPHLLQTSGGIAAEVKDLRDDLIAELSLVAGIAVEEFTNQAAADVNAIKLSIASAAAIQTYTGAALDGVVGLLAMSPPRNISITSTVHADIDAVAVVITGKDVNGDDITESITLTDGGGVTDVGAKAFAKVTSIVVPAQSGVGGALEFGFGDIIGFLRPLKSRAGLAAVVREIAVGAVVTTGTFVAAPAVAGAGQPNGTYLAAAVPDAT
ncbi:MAG: hypothetical protein E4H01_07840, partial [Lysobacterales bacterium]